MTMGISMTASEKAARMLKGRSMEQLISEFIMTGVMNDPNIPRVRGWYMDEFQRRDPEAFERWLDGDAIDEDLGKYFT